MKGHDADAAPRGERRRTFVGFGFGAIQGGLFVYEAQRSGNFARLVVAEVLPEVVESVRRAGGRYGLNVAQADGLQRSEVGPVEMENPRAAADRARLILALASAQEIATAVPSVDHYRAGGPESLDRLLAEGLTRKASAGGPAAVVYAAENHTRAAELLEEAVLEAVPAQQRAGVRKAVRFVGTVIGKMSGVVGPAEIAERRLLPVAPGLDRAFLVEEFNRILISRIDVGPRLTFRRGIEVFEEKADLMPFAEAKLYGHNATHAAAAYVGALAGAARMADLRAWPPIMAFLRAAFLEESGAALVRKYGGVDPLFTAEGYRAYADGLLARMTNPWLGDAVERVGRNPERKLGWDDRLAGTMRLALSQGIEPRRYAVGAAAGLAAIDPQVVQDRARARPLLERIWGAAAGDGPEKQAIIKLIEEGLGRLRAWRRSGFASPRAATS